MGHQEDTELTPQMFVANVFSRACPSRKVLELIGGKWGSLTLAALDESPMRFNALRRKVTGVSEKMLSQTLHQLERSGMVTRTVHTSIPPHVEYHLTPIGRKVARQLLALIDVLESEFPDILAAQIDYDERAAN